MTSKIWIEDPKILIQKNKLLEFVPRMEMSYAQRINSIVRFSILTGIVLALLHNNYLYLYIPIVVAVITYLLYITQSDKVKESYQNLPRPLDPVNENPMLDKYKAQQLDSIEKKKKCVKPSRENPFMNALPSDNRTRMPACQSYDDEDIANQVEANFGHNLFKDVTDVYNKRHSERQYYTMPSTQFANEQGKFAMWLYGLPPTCKEGNGAQCVANNHTRLNQASRPLF